MALKFDYFERVFFQPTSLVKRGQYSIHNDVQNRQYQFDKPTKLEYLNVVQSSLHMQDPLLMQHRTRASVIDRNWTLVNQQLINHYRELIADKSGALKEAVA
jgi:hypothetical protein